MKANLAEKEDEGRIRCACREPQEFEARPPVVKDYFDTGFDGFDMWLPVTLPTLAPSVGRQLGKCAQLALAVDAGVPSDIKTVFNGLMSLMSLALPASRAILIFLFYNLQFAQRDCKQSILVRTAVQGGGPEKVGLQHRSDYGVIIL